MLPAGLMWSVVMLSPNSASTRAPVMSVDRRGRHGDALEIGRVLHVGAAAVPAVDVAADIDLDRLPLSRALEHLAVAVEELLAGDARLHDLLDLGVARPDVAQIDGLAVRAGAERRRGDVLVHRAEQRVSDDQGRAGQVVGAHVRVHAALEVAVAGQHGHGDELVVLDRVGDRLLQRAGVADAGGAAVADELEAERVEVLGQAGAVEILGDDLAAGGERGLHPGRGVSPFCRALRATSPAPSITYGLVVLVQEVIAAITTSPWVIS